MTTIREKAHEIMPYLVELRRENHRHPEPSFKEFETTNRLAAELDKLGIPYKRMEPTGLMAEIKGGKPGKTVLLRADIDALEILEKTDVPFRSENEGIMHACGHDTHMTNLMGAARILNDMKDELNGNVRLIWQPGEEIAKGAYAFIDQKALEGVDGVYGQHIWPLFPCGTVAYRSCGAWASCDGFTLKVIGKATHGSAPENGVDATVCASAIVMNLQTIVSREVAAMKPLVVTVGSLHSGTRFNICSGEAELTGTCRCFDVELHHHIPEMMERIIKATCEAYRCEYEFEYNFMTEPVINRPDMTEIAKEAALKVTDGPDCVIEHDAIMAAEDFAAYMVDCPGTFCLIGGGGEYPVHSDYFWINEDSLEIGSAMYAQFAVDFLNK